MFGYVKIDKPEMKVKEYEAYRGLYCSLCKSMGKNFGVLSRLTLSYDITFLVLLRLSFTSVVPDFKQGRCPFNPAKKCNYCKNADDEMLYASAVSMMMFYFKVRDNIADGSFFKKLIMYFILPYAFIKYKKARKLFPDVAQMIHENMQRQSEKEKSFTKSTDEAAHESADALGKIIAYNLSDESKNIYKTGYGVGKWVYLCDAADDLKKDITKGNYNVFALKYDLDTADIDNTLIEDIEYTLNMSCAYACEGFENIKNKTIVPIIENIMYNGMRNVMNNILKGNDKK